MLSMKCKYALKALIRLGMNRGNESVHTAYIAREENIPKKFLEQILLELKHAGFVSSRQGSKGGYYLLKRPREISVADVYRLFDGAIALLPCVAVKYYRPCEDCRDEKSCNLRREFLVIKERSRKIMKQTTIQSFLKKPGKRSRKK